MIKIDLKKTNSGEVFIYLKINVMLNNMEKLWNFL